MSEVQRSGRDLQRSGSGMQRSGSSLEPSKSSLQRSGSGLQRATGFDLPSDPEAPEEEEIYAVSEAGSALQCGMGWKIIYLPCVCPMTCKQSIKDDRSF